MTLKMNISVSAVLVDWENEMTPEKYEECCKAVYDKLASHQEEFEAVQEQFIQSKFPTLGLKVIFEE